MANPIIDSPTPGTSLIFAPGETKTIQIVAHDPDTGPPVSQVFKVTDSTGNVSPIAVTLQEQDTLTYSADPPPAGWTITQQVDLTKFSVKAPG